MITLGIIGVVAALTMPALISNHQKKVYVTQLKKSVNTLTNGFKLMLADAGVDSLEDTNLFINNGSSTLKTINANELKKYFNIVKLDDNFANYQFKSISGGIVYAHNVYGGSDSTKCIMLTFEDGTDACLIPNSNSEIAVSSLIDVNGTNRLPNVLGADVFGAYFDYHGMLYFDSYTSNYAPATLNSRCYYGSSQCCLKSVVNNNWEITYY